MRALVTGATGMLGARLVERLLGEGWNVRALARDPSRAAWLEAQGVRVAAGDLTDPESLAAAAAGCDAVFDAAAAIGPGGDHEAFRRVNVTGTAHVLAAAAAAGSRLVHVSSTSVFGRQRYRPTPTDETAALPELPEADAYGRSKQEAERLVLDAHAQGRVSAVVGAAAGHVRPARPPVRPPPRAGAGAGCLSADRWGENDPHARPRRFGRPRRHPGRDDAPGRWARLSPDQ